ncbi:MAG TPA: carbon-nitrogen hydrolase family protein [Gemmataceae bacterium]|jgi:predicted amidohydrolase|nr:carbon-nitrogen hydrolase family protein [Gemmataceae bacterium]
MARLVRLAAVSAVPPAYDMKALREIVLRVAADKPDLIAFPEICACASAGLVKGVQGAEEIASHAEAIGKLAREVNSALVVPLLERHMGQVYNSVPIVDRTGKLTMVYRKNYPTTGEMEASVTPGWEVPVAECDGMRIGAAVCFDVNFPQVALELEKQRARVVVWPSMFWGGEFLQHWALRHGFYVVVAYAAESAIIDMGGRYLVKQGLDTSQVRAGRLPPWCVAEVNVDREVFHLDFNQNKFQAIRAKYGPDVEIDVRQPEAIFLLANRRAGTTVEAIAKEFGLETLRDYLSRSAKMREERLRGHKPG